MSEWKYLKIQDLVDTKKYSCVGGPFGSNLISEDYIDTPGVPVIRGNNFVLGSQYFYDEGFVFVSDKKADSLFQNTAYQGDVVFTQRGTIGNVALIPKNTKFSKYVLSQNLMKLSVDPEKADPRFICYYFLSPRVQETITRNSIGSTIPGFNLTQLRNFPVLLPSLKEQTKIADVLSCLDRKISNLRQQNETLEAIAQTLFKHWFVDFEFPNEDGKPYRSSGGEMVRSELGEIPAGWKVGKLGDFCDVKHGYAFKGEFITTEETDQILLTPGNFRIGGGFNSSKYKYYSNYDYDEDYVLAPDDLVINMTDLSKEGDTLGYPAFVPKHSKNVFLHNQRLGKIVDSQIDLFFLFFLLCRREYRSHILGTASGSTVRHTSPSRILECEFIVPSMELLENFSSTANNLIRKSFLNHAQIETLNRTRDVLLSKLISGQLRID